MAQFLTFHLDASAPAGSFKVTGEFDESWGFQFYQGPAGSSRFRTISLTNNSFEVSWGGGTNHRFNPRFSNANQNGYTFSGSLANMVAETAQVVNIPV